MTNFTEIIRMNFQLPLYVLFGIFIFNTPVYGQVTQKIAFYNVENLFDTLDTPGKDDAEFLPNSPNAWNSSKYLEKVAHINQVFEHIGQPVIFGMCEIENAAVVQDVVNRGIMKGNYDVVHFESMDERGIDNALVYDTRYFSLGGSGIISVNLPEKSGPTRDILWARLERGNDVVLVMVNHWPSRRGGQIESEPSRLVAAIAAKSFIDSIQATNKAVKIVFMGDLNDYPTDRAPQMISSTLTPMIVDKSGEFGGSSLYNHEWNIIDHIMVSSNCFKKKGFSIVKNSGVIHSPKFILTTYKDEIMPARTYAGGKYLAGYSDHLPVSINLQW